MATINYNKPLITIGIPTYMRKDAIVKRIEEIKQKTLPDEVEILVIDNASTDGTFEALIEQCLNTDIKVLQNSANLGFQGNFVQLLKKCNGTYLLCSSDEDEILIENLKGLISFLKKRTPSYVSSQYFLDEKLYRGRKTIEDMKALDVWNTAHLPGSVFHKELSQQFVSNFEELQLRFPTIITYYPHLELIIHLLIKGKGYWFDKPLTEQKNFLQYTHSKDADGVEYYNLTSRWKQWKEYREYLDYYDNKYSLKDIELSKFKEISTELNQKLYISIRRALVRENPEYGELLDYGALKRRKKLFLPNRVINKLKKIIQRK